MRSRRSVQLLVVASVIVTACGGREQAADQPTAAPPASVDATPSTIPGRARVLPIVTTTGRAPVLPIVTTTAATSAATTATSPAPLTTGPATSPALATTLSPTTLPATAIATTTRQVVTLPPGVTEADRIAAESAAIGWWEEVQVQTKALPEFDPQAILARTVPGRPAGPAMVATLEKRQKDGFSLRTGTVDQTVLLGTRFLSSDLVEVQVCLADDNFFVQQITGVQELAGLGRSFYLSVLRRSAGGWKIDDWGSFRDSEDGVPCE